MTLITFYQNFAHSFVTHNLISWHCIKKTSSLLVSKTLESEVRRAQEEELVVEMQGELVHEIEVLVWGKLDELEMVLTELV